ncbi:hypothetical protein [Cupriavidus necator]
MTSAGESLLAASPADQVSSAARDVLAERRRQIEAEGYDPEHDDAHGCGEIAAMAALYAMPPAVRNWCAESTGYGATFGEAILPHGWAAKLGGRRRELVKAGALILAEIERIDRASAPKMIFDSPPCAGVARPLAPGKEQA